MSRYFANSASSTFNRVPGGDDGMADPTQHGQFVVGVRRVAVFGRVGFGHVVFPVPLLKAVNLVVRGPLHDRVDRVPQHGVVHAATIDQPAGVHGPDQVAAGLLKDAVVDVLGLIQVMPGGHRQVGRVRLPFDGPDVLDQVVLVLVEGPDQRPAQFDTVGGRHRVVAVGDVEVPVRVGPFRRRLPDAGGVDHHPVGPGGGAELVHGRLVDRLDLGVRDADKTGRVVGMPPVVVLLLPTRRMRSHSGSRPC